MNELGRFRDVRDRRQVAVDAETEECLPGRDALRRAVVASPIAPIWGGDSVGAAHGMRLIEPPSWSVAISSGG